MHKILLFEYALSHKMRYYLIALLEQLNGLFDCFIRVY